MTTKDHRIGGLNKRHVLLIVLEDGESKIKVLANSVLGEGSMPSLQAAQFLTHLHIADIECSGVSSSFYEDTKLSCGPTLTISFIPYYCCPHAPN